MMLSIPATNYQWAVTAVAHPALRDVRPICPDCLALAETGVTTARATGSRGSTTSDGSHSATVARVLATVTVEA